MAKGSITLSGSTVGTKMESLEVEQLATGGVAGAFKVDNNDTDKQAMVIEASNIDADVMDITMDAVTTAKGIDITADALTTGSALYIDSDSSSTASRNIATIIQNHSSASGSTTLYLQNDHATADALLAKGAVTVGVDDIGHDVKFFGATSGKSLLWDESADSLIVTGTTTLVGTTNLDAVDIDGATQIDAAITVGEDDTGYDVKFFGATASRSLLWDESVNELVIAGKIKQRFGSAFHNVHHHSWVMGG